MLFDANETMNEMLAKIQKKQLDDSGETYEQCAARMAEIERVEKENARINWLNEFFLRTPNHDLPLSADTARLDSLDSVGPDREATLLIKAWKPSDEFGFLLLGPAGCGKSYVLQALARSILFDSRDFSAKRLALRWFPVTGGLSKIRKEMHENYDGLKSQAIKADYLFFDDLGAESLTEWTREQIYEIIEHRINFKLTTFISSNCTLDELKTRYHERFVSRLKEICIPIQLKGADRRGDKMKLNMQTLRSRVNGDKSK